MSFVNAIHPDDRERILAKLPDQAQGGFDEKYRIVQPNASVRWVHARTFPIRDEHGEVYRACGIAQDITARKQTEEALRESEEKFRGFFQGAAEGILVSNIETKKFVYANPAVCRMLGYTEEELVYLGVSDIHPPEDLERVVAEFMAQARGEKTLASALPCLRKDGTTIYADINASRLVVEGKDCSVGFFTDITERKRAEEALRRSETKFRTLYDSTSDAVMLLDEKGFFDCNQATLAIFGCATREEFCSKHPADLSPPEQPCGTDSLTLANQRIATAMEKGSNHFEWMHKRADTGETFPADVLLNAMELDGKPVLQAVVRDITERKRAEEALRASEQRSRIIAESVTDVIYEWDLKDKVEWYGDVDSLMGYPTGGFPRTLDGWAAALHPEDKERVWLAIESQLKGAAPYNVEYRIADKDGGWRWWSARGTVLRDEQGQPRRWIGAVTDITERKQAEEALRRYASELESAKAVQEENATRLRQLVEDLGEAKRQAEAASAGQERVPGQYEP